MNRTLYGTTTTRLEAAAETLPGQGRNIPSLDGIRAISIVTVLFAHARWMMPDWLTASSPFRFIIGNGIHGVAIFFVISGYLITTLLLREQRRSGTISLKQFYWRRTLRIFPPYYVFLGVMGLLWAGHWLSLDRTSFVAAATYIWSVTPYASEPLLTHCWSLSIEELFYLLWPFTVLFVRRTEKLLLLSTGLIVLFPFLRVGLYFIAPALRGHEFYMVQGWGDTILFGCLLALARQKHRFEEWQTRFLKGWMVVALAFAAFYLAPALQASLRGHVAGLFTLAINPTLVAISSATIVLYLTTRTGNAVSRMLNTGPIRHLGVLSYSLYLWQQIFMAHSTNFGWWGFPLAFGTAELSFWVVERPALRLRSRLEDRVSSRTITAGGPGAVSPQPATPTLANVDPPSAGELTRSIPSLDGLRAFSILTVILGHSVWFLPVAITRLSFYQYGIGNGGLGVRVFFVISGFLITTILLRELEKTGTIALGRFYFRRSMRIFPAFYFYLLVVALFWIRRVWPEDPASFIASATYTWSYYPKAQGVFLQHSWSLSVEEQFYLFWPALLVFLKVRRRMIVAAIVIILILPMFRVLMYFANPGLRGQEYYLVYGWLDTMMVGCLLALVYRLDGFQLWKQRWLNAWSASLMTAIAVYLNAAFNAILPKPYAGFYTLVLLPVTSAVCISGAMLYVVENRNSLAGRVLNLGWVRKIGVLSYSLYLWQQIFVFEKTKLLPWGYAYLFVVAVLSYWLVEQPFLRLRTIMEARVRR